MEGIKILSYPPKRKINVKYALRVSTNLQFRERNKIKTRGAKKELF